MRVLFIARYRDITMRRKVDYLAQTPDLEVLYVTPARWQDELLEVTQTDSQGPYRQLALPMHGKPTDPHRAIFHTLDFAMRGFRPHIIHAEEEPDSLSALHIAWARQRFAPRARLLLHTWQNVDRPRSQPVCWVMNRTLAAADVVFCANREAADILRRHGFTRQLPVIPAVGVDTEIFRPCPKRPRLASDPPVLGFVGRFVPEKGIEDLLHALALVRSTTMPHVRLLLIGHGPRRADLEALAADLRISDAVEFVRPLPPSRIAEAMCSLDILVLPSRTTVVWKEQLGRVLLEAMACGVPVIGSSSGAIPEVIGNAGLIFREGDVTALAKGIWQLSQDVDLYRRYSESGLQRVHEQYSQQVLAAETVAVYRQILAAFE